MPDYRECVLVGTGQSTRTEITEHDVYTLGEFKDDQFQGHYHNASGYEANSSGSPISINTLSRQGTWRTSIVRVQEPITDGTNGTPRTGTTTHGKQIGVNYIIKY